MKNKNKHNQHTEIIYGKNACFGCLQGYQYGLKNREIFAIYILQAKFDEFYKKIPTDLKQIVKRCNAHDMFVLTHEQDKHQGIAIKVSTFHFLQLEDMLDMITTKSTCDTNRNVKSSIFLLDRVQDPQNLGNIIRSAFCFGIDGILLSEHDSCGITPSVVRASAGYSECSVIGLADNISLSLKKLKANDYWVIGFDVNTNTADALTDVIAKYDKCVFVFGSEGQGMKELTKKNCDLLIKLPMIAHAESLNVANTATIVGWEIMKNKQQSH